MNKPLATPNLIQIKNDYPAAYEDIQKMAAHINLIAKSLGGLAEPVAEGGISVTGTNGIIDVTVTDRHPEVGEEYFLLRDTQPSFATAHTIPLVAVRNYRDSTVAGLTTYWAWYKSTKLGGTSGRIVFGNPPTGVTPGNLSIVAGGPTPGPSQGSGRSQIPGYGYGEPRNQPIQRLNEL